MIKLVQTKSNKWTLHHKRIAIVYDPTCDVIETLAIPQRDMFLIMLVMRQVKKRNWRSVGRFRKYGIEVFPRKTMTLLMEHLADVDFENNGVDFVRDDFEKILTDFKGVITEFYATNGAE